MTSFEDKKCSKMVDALKGLDDNELISIFRQANGYSNDFDFCDGWDMDEFIQIMMQGKQGSELRDFIYDISNAVDEYDGTDGIEYAQWGYFDGYCLEIKDMSDIIEEAREDYIEDLANDIIDMYGSDKYSDVLPREIEDVLYLFKQYEEYGWEGEGKYRIVYEDDTHSMWFEFGEDDFDSYSEWLDEAEVDGINKRVEFFE